MFLRFGRNGYTRIMRYALDHATYLRDRLIKSGKFQIMNQAQRIPVVALTLDESVKRYNEFDISNKVREKGWILSAYSMPPNVQEINSLRIVVRPHLNRDVSQILASDIEEACEYLEEHGGNRDTAEASWRAQNVSEVLRVLWNSEARRAQFLLHLQAR
jgi:glutamate decarboxylase